jgi:hypothetical protein
MFFCQHDAKKIVNLFSFTSVSIIHFRTFFHGSLLALDARPVGLASALEHALVQINASATVLARARQAALSWSRAIY